MGYADLARLGLPESAPALEDIEEIRLVVERAVDRGQPGEPVHDRPRPAGGSIVDPPRRGSPFRPGNDLGHGCGRER